MLSLDSSAQTIFNEFAFRLRCKCTKEQFQYNAKNKSYNYLIVDEGTGAMYKIITKKNSIYTNKKFMLELFKKETPGYNFREIIFKGYEAIIGKGAEVIDGNSLKTYLINFFSNNTFYTVTIYAFDYKDLENALNSFTNSITLK